MKMATNFAEILQDKLLHVPCHFSWESLQNENVGRTVELNIENLHEHIEEAIQGTEVMSHNLMGFYQTQLEHFEEARASFEKALENSHTEDEKIVSLGCLAWLTWKESSSDSCSEEQVEDRINQAMKILRGRNPEAEIPEVMAEKAFAIANSGFTEKGFEEAFDCIDRAFENRPVDVMYKFTKATILQQFYGKKYKNKAKDEAEVEKIKRLFQELIASLESNPKYPALYGQVLVQYAMFLHQINRDYGTSGKEYAEKAEEIARCHKATAVMRNVAKFYMKSAGKSIDVLEKSEALLEEILTLKADGNYKEISILAGCLSNKYRLTSSHDAFAKAEDCFRKAWDSNKKFVFPALDFVRLYQMKYDKTRNVGALVKAEKIFQEIFRDTGGKEQLIEAMICSRFGEFLKGYGKELASSYREYCPGYKGDPVRSPRIEQALQLIDQYTEDKQDEHLLQAERIFKQVHNDWENLGDPEKVRFNKEFAAFLDRYSDHLAFCYLTKSLELNPHQGYAFKPLKELARRKTVSRDKRERMKGYRTLEKIAQLETGQELKYRAILPHFK